MRISVLELMMWPKTPMTSPKMSTAIRAWKVCLLGGDEEDHGDTNPIFEGRAVRRIARRSALSV